MKLNYTILLLLFVSICSAQVTNEGSPLSWRASGLSAVEPIVMPGFNLAGLQEEDRLNDDRKDKPWRYGFEFFVDHNLLNSGKWTALPNGDRIWRIRYASAGARTMNFLFSDYLMPAGAKLYLYNNDRTDLLGAYDAAQNNERRELGTWLVDGDDVWIEYYEPKQVAGQGKLEIYKVVHGYRSIPGHEKAPEDSLNDSGDCNYDVNCFIGDVNNRKYVNKRSVGLVIVNNSSFCTGALVNNTANNGTPYFLTAHHCLNNQIVSQWAFRFNWISPNPVCASNSDSTSNSTFHQTVSGAVLRASNEQTDFALVELTSNIPGAWDVVWAGWDRSDIVPASTFGIHHPSGDIMKVCRDVNAPVHDNDGGTFMWRVEDWDMGVTETGSSGSPLFDNNGRIIGQLYGGDAACAGFSDNNAPDYYGRFAKSWNGVNSSLRLKDWLDPLNSNALVLDYKSNLPLSVEEMNGEAVKVFPNPSSGRFTITGTNAAHYSLYTILGQPIQHGKLIDGDNSLDLSAAANGVYLLRISNEATGSSSVYKIVKE